MARLGAGFYCLPADLLRSAGYLVHAMTKRERKAVAALLLEWAQWCYQQPHADWWLSPFYMQCHYPVFKAAWVWCYNGAGPSHKGSDAALALCFAAAYVEAGGEL